MAPTGDAAAAEGVPRHARRTLVRRPTAPAARHTVRGEVSDAADPILFPCVSQYFGFCVAVSSLTFGFARVPVRHATASNVLMGALDP